MDVKQGEIWWVSPTPKIGSEQRGTRPGLVVQNDFANGYLKTTIVALISSSGERNIPEIVRLGPADGLKEGSGADFSQLWTIDKERLFKKIGRIESIKWTLVEKALSRIFMKTF